MQRKKERARKTDRNRFMLMRISEKQNKKLLNYIRLLRKYARIVAKLMLAIPMLIVRQPVQKKGIGEFIGFRYSDEKIDLLQICSPGCK